MIEKREMIEKALGDLVEPIFEREEFAGLNFDAIAEQIVIECEVEHEPGLTYIGYGSVGAWRRDWIVDGHHGVPGKALAIIVPLGEEK